MLRIYVVIFFLIFFKNSISYSQIQIKYKVDEEIITNIDILNEEKYLIFLRPSLNKLPQEEIVKISTNSLIKEIIKKKELKKIFKDIEKKEYAEIKKNLFNFKKVKNENEFLDLIKKNNISYDKILEKIKYEALWNELVYQKYNSYVKINEVELKNDLEIKITNNKKYEYNLSELLFEIETNDDFKKKYKEILKYIANNSFKAAANRYSISNSSSKGGEIGWVKETLLSDNLNDILNKMKKLEITKPIKYPTGYLILKINDKRRLWKSKGNG